MKDKSGVALELSGHSSNVLKEQLMASQHDDRSQATFEVQDEDHTLANPVRYMLTKK